MTPPVEVAVSEVLDYFGKCPRCQYPASAVRTTRRFSDNRIETTVVATCNLPCGWQGPVPLTTMTDARKPDDVVKRVARRHDCRRKDRSRC